MTRASKSRRERRRRVGRPKNVGIDPVEQQKIQLATALQAAWHISGRKAIDLVLAMTEAEMESVGPHHDSFRLPYTTFSGRESTLRKKRKDGAVPPDETTDLMALALKCESLEAALRLFRSLLTLAETKGPGVMDQAVQQLLDKRRPRGRPRS